MNKNGFSQVVSTVVLIALTIALVAGVLTIIRTFVDTGLKKTSSCNDLFEKVSINPDYTCFDSSSNSTLISISRKEIALDSLLVSVSYGDFGKKFFLKDGAEAIENLTNYGVGTSNVSLPGNESGKTYCFSGFYSPPSEIKIAPRIGGTRCSVVDSMKEIPTCAPSLKC